MRVLLVHTYYRRRGGEDTVFESEIEQLKKGGHEVDTICFQNAPYTLLKFFLLFFNIGSYLKMRRKMKAFKPDLVHLHNFFFGASLGVIPAIQKDGTPLVMTLHNYRILCPTAFLFHKGKIFTNSLEEKFPWTAVKEGVYHDSRLLTLWMVLSFRLFNRFYGWKKVNRFIVLNEDVKEKILESKLGIRIDQISVKTNFVEDLPLEELERGDHFLYAGRLSEEKGILVALAAFSNSQAKLTIIGDGPLRKDVEEACAKNNNITYLGFRKPEFVRQELQKCSSLIFPSVCFEGAPMTIMEAFGCRTPVIASRIGVMKTMVKEQDNGLFFEPGNAKDLRQKVEKWSALPKEEKCRYQKNARAAYQENYTPQKKYEQLIQIYGEAVAKNKPAPLPKREFSLTSQ